MGAQPVHLARDWDPHPAGGAGEFLEPRMGCFGGVLPPGRAHA